MHGNDRHRIILPCVQDRAIARVQVLCELTGASEATIRRDVAALDAAGRLRRARGGAEARATPTLPGLAGRPFRMNEGAAHAQEVAIARAAADLWVDGEPIIINGGTTTFEMAHPLATRRLQILTDSFPIAQHLLGASRNTILLPGGTIYRAQNIVPSPFASDVAGSFWARRMYMGCQGLGPLGSMEADPLLIQAEEKLIGQADSSRFAGRSSLILCPLERIHTVITDDGVPDAAARMIEAAGIRLIAVTPKRPAGRAAASGEVTTRGRDDMTITGRTLGRWTFGAGLAALALLAGTVAQAQDPVRIALVVKALGIGFFEAANEAAQEAAAEFGDVEVIHTGPTDATAEGQIEVINALIARQVDAIAVSANHTDALVPTLERAMQRGITVISWHSGVAPEGRQMHLDPSSSAPIGT